MRREGGSRVPEWAVAVTRRDDILVLRLDRVDRGRGNALDRVLAHEAVHQVLTHLGGGPLPRWFEEGLCVYYAGVAYLEFDSTLQRLAAGGNLPAFEETDAAFRADAASAAAAYRLGESVVTHFIERFGDESVRRLLDRVAEGLEFDAAFLDTTGATLAEFERGWRITVTPDMPFLVFILLENIDLALLCLGALLVAAAYIRWRLRRERAMSQLGEG
jgi:hypothetical protein